MNTNDIIQAHYDRVFLFFPFLSSEVVNTHLNVAHLDKSISFVDLLPVTVSLCRVVLLAEQNFNPNTILTHPPF